MSISQYFSWIFLGCTALLVCVYVYVYFKNCKIPIILSGNKEYGDFLHKILTSAHKRYWPSFWFFLLPWNAFSFFSYCFTSLWCIVYKRLLRLGGETDIYSAETLTASDGEIVHLDWRFCTPEWDSETRPILLWIPGVCGSWKVGHAQLIALSLSKVGCRFVGFNLRGAGNRKPKIGKTSDPCNTNDLADIILHIKKRFPNAPLFALSECVYGPMLTKYLIEYGHQTNLQGAILLATMFSLNNYIEIENGFSKLSKYLMKIGVQHLLEKVYRWKDISHNGLLNFDELKRVTKYSELLVSLHFKLNGYSNAEDFYEKFDVRGKLRQIQIPTLAIHSSDDDLCKEIPSDEDLKDSLVGMLVLAKGGHTFFLEGFSPNPYPRKIIKEFIDGILQSKNDKNKRRF